MERQVVRPRPGIGARVEPLREPPAAVERGLPELIQLGPLGRMARQPGQRGIALGGVPSNALPATASVRQKALESVGGPHVDGHPN